MPSVPTLMSIIRAYAIALFVVLWVVVGWQDWRRKKIAHKYLLYALLGAGAGYGALAGALLAGGGGPAPFPDRAYWPAVGINSLLCLFAAMALWVMRIWPAGDAKLFICLSLLLPLMSLLGSFPAERLFLVVLINIFIPAAVFLFLRACVYLFDTRLRHMRDFLIQLGWKRELDFILESLRSSWDGFAAGLRAKRAQGPAALLRALGGLIPVVLRWLSGMACMALLSYYLRDFFSSPVLLSLLCMGMFLLWSRLSAALGSGAARLALAAAAAALLWHKPPSDWGVVAAIFGSVSVFGFCMFLGVNWAMAAMSGGGHGGISLVLPFLVSGLGLALASLWGYLSQAASAVLGLLPEAGASWAGAAVAGGAGAALETLISLAFLGLFFGLSLAAVRKWDDEVRPSHTPETLAATLVLDRSFLDRIREDPEFHEAHFQSLYADGLTGEQAQALKEWCVQKGIEKVPMAPTISFAFWIFLGFFMSWVLGGGHLLQAIL